MYSQAWCRKVNSQVLVCGLISAQAKKDSVISGKLSGTDRNEVVGMMGVAIKVQPFEN